MMINLKFPQIISNIFSYFESLGLVAVYDIRNLIRLQPAIALCKHVQARWTVSLQ